MSGAVILRSDSQEDTMVVGVLEVGREGERGETTWALLGSNEREQDQIFEICHKALCGKTKTQIIPAGSVFSLQSLPAHRTHSLLQARLVTTRPELSLIIEQNIC